MEQPILATHDLSKKYSDVLAADQVSITVNRGEIYGFLGLNGAGKSTTIRMLLGMIKPTQGHVVLFGERISNRTTGVWHRVGHLVEAPTAYGELSVQENLEVARRLQGTGDPRAVDQVIELMGLQTHRRRKARVLSQGNLQRLGLARALLHQPELLVLDEPANGLDPAGVVEIRALLRRLAREAGVTVFMSSHILAEIDKLATRIGIIHQGRLVEEMSAGEMESRRRHRLEVELRDLAAAAQVLRENGFEQVTHAGANGKAWLEVSDPLALDHPEEVAALLSGHRLPPSRLVVTQDDLEDYFLQLTTGGARL